MRASRFQGREFNFCTNCHPFNLVMPAFVAVGFASQHLQGRCQGVAWAIAPWLDHASF